MSDSPATGVDEGNKLTQKLAEATRCTIISLDTHLNGMAARRDLTRSLTVRIKRSISGTCSFLDEQFRFIPTAVISLSSGSKYLSPFMCVILKPHCRYNLCNCVIPSAMFLIFRFWPYFLWQTWCAVIWCLGNQFHWYTWGHRKLWPPCNYQGYF